MGDRLLAEDLLARRGCFFDESGVGVGGGADQNGIDAFVIQDAPIILVNCRDRKPGSHLLCGLHKDVGHSQQVCLWYTVGQVLSMQPADPSRTDDAKVHPLFHDLLSSPSRSTAKRAILPGRSPTNATSSRP